MKVNLLVTKVQYATEALCDWQRGNGTTFQKVNVCIYFITPNKAHALQYNIPSPKTSPEQLVRNLKALCKKMPRYTIV